MEYDLFVIGAGSGGVRAARWSASLGAKVAIAEESEFGGTCVVRGCIPKKLMVYASEYSHEKKLMRHYGWDVVDEKFCLRALKTNRDNEIKRLSGLYKGMLDKNQVSIYKGRAQLLSKHEIEVNGEILTAKNILIATGSRPYLPSKPGIEHALISDDIFKLDKLPHSIAIVGGGYIAVEFACIFAGLGSKVNLYVRSQRLLNGFDQECAEFLCSELVKKGIQINFNNCIESIVPKSNGYRVKDKISIGVCS